MLHTPRPHLQMVVSSSPSTTSRHRCRGGLHSLHQQYNDDATAFRSSLSTCPTVCVCCTRYELRLKIYLNPLGRTRKFQTLIDPELRPYLTKGAMWTVALLWPPLPAGPHLDWLRSISIKLKRKKNTIKALPSGVVPFLNVNMSCLTCCWKELSLAQKCSI
jgi:hypothetical protein